MNINKSLGKYLFSFAVLGDTHVNHEEGNSTSPFACNQLADGRLRYAVGRLNQMKPEAVVHLGDFVNPVPHLDTFKTACNNFKTIYANLDAKSYLVPGNHDIGDKSVDWMPAGHVCSEYIEQYRSVFGKDYYSFDCNNIHGIVINSSLINSGNREEKRQQEWLESNLKDNSGKRIFIFSHYPPFLFKADEKGHYDNMDNPGRQWLLKILDEYKIEGFIAGHVHNFFYNQLSHTRCYVLPSITFVRHDFSELFKKNPTEDMEHGRDDKAKFGFLMIKVYENGHVPHLIRTYGKTLPDHKIESPDCMSETFHSQEISDSGVGLDLRHPWSEIVDIAPGGAVDEFERKRVRNDYSLLAIWEAGVKKLRIPLQDLIDDNYRQRVTDLSKIGHEFSVYNYGLPTKSELFTIKKLHKNIHSLELVLKWTQLEETISFCKEAEFGIPVYFSPLRNFLQKDNDVKHFKHLISHGFIPDDKEWIEEIFAKDEKKEVVKGIVFRLPRKLTNWESFEKCSQLADLFTCKAKIIVQLCSENLAESFINENDNANLAAKMIAASYSFENIEIYHDTFIDVDRSYFCRTGLYDRFYNPRPAGNVFRNLHAFFDRIPKIKFKHQINDKFESIQINKNSALLLPLHKISLNKVNIGIHFSNIIDLNTGEKQKLTKNLYIQGPVLLIK